MRISDWSSDVCSSDLRALAASGALDPFNRNRQAAAEHLIACLKFETGQAGQDLLFALDSPACPNVPSLPVDEKRAIEIETLGISFDDHPLAGAWSHIRRLSAVSLSKIEDFAGCGAITVLVRVERSEEHTSELQSLMRISYAVFCLKKKQHKS